MCKLASFIYRQDPGTLQVELFMDDLESHSNTYSAAGKTMTEAQGWYEGHYTPEGEVECRSPEGRNTLAEKDLLEQYPSFYTFVWNTFRSGLLPYSSNSIVLGILQTHNITF